MEEQNTWIGQLNILQSNILSLFEGVLKEKNEYKEGNDVLSASLKQMIGRIDILERQNEMLRKCNASMRNVFIVGLKTFRKLDLSCVNSIKENVVSLELLQKLFLESSERIEFKSDTIYKMQLSSGDREKNEEVDTIKTLAHEDQIEVKKFGFENCNAPALVKSENDIGRDERGQELELNSPEDILRNIVGKKSQGADAVKRRLIQVDSSNLEEVGSTICKLAEPPPPQINGSVLGSPVFKDARKQDPARTEDPDEKEPIDILWTFTPRTSCFASRRLIPGIPARQTHLRLRGPENKSSKSTALKLINEKYVEKSAQLLISPWKPQQADGGPATKGQFTPKRGKSDLKFPSPSRSPSIVRCALRKSNSREGDSGSSGGRKLTQTFLNIDCFKQKSPVSTKNSRNGEDGNTSKRTRLDKVEDDDLIFDSPKRAAQVLEAKKEEDKNESESCCLDETFISSPAVRQFNSGQMEDIIRKQSAAHNPPQQKSPECDSVPFVYKREAIRKKEERMKLPGHPCVQCEKYYKNALGDVDANDLGKILNKCSRHRDKNPPALDDTPPGYWKPYLTCTSIYSPNKNDAR